MPTVPVLRAPTVQEQAGPSARIQPAADLEAFGGGQSREGVTRAADRALGDVGKFFAAEKLKADSLAYQDARNQAKKAYNDLLYGNKEIGEAGAFSKKGKDALGLNEEYIQKYRESTDQIYDGLSNQTQKQAFDRARQEIGIELDETLQKYSFKERASYDDEVTQASIKNSFDDAVTNYLNPERVQQAIDEQHAVLIDNAKRNGVSPEKLSLDMADNESKTRTGVVTRMLNSNQDIAAQEYFNQHKDRFTGQDSAALEKALEVGSLLGKSQRNVDAMLGKKLTESQAIKEAAKIEDPKERQATEDRISSYFNRQNAAEKATQEALFENAAKIAEQTLDYDQIPKDSLAKMSASQRAALKKLASGDEIRTDQATWAMLYEMGSVPATRDKFLKTDLYQYKTKLSPADFQELQKFKHGLRKEDPSALEQAATTGERNQVINQTLAAFDIDPTPKPGSSDAERVAQFNRRVDDEIRRQFQGTGKKPTKKDIQSIVDVLMTPTGKSTGWFGFGTKERLFEKKADESVSIGYEDIPDGEKSKIQDALKRRGVQPTNDKILQMYIAKVRSTQ